VRTEIFRLFGEHGVEFGKRLVRPVLAIEDERKIAPRGGKARRQLDCAAEQLLRIGIPPNPPGKLRQHPDRGNIERILPQMRLEQRLGDVKLIVMQRERGVDQAARVAAWKRL
jgi:hypothetical protein